MQVSPTDAWAIRRALVKFPIEGIEVSPSTRLMMKAFNLETQEGYKHFSQVVTSDPELLIQVMNLDPATPPVVAAPSNENIVYVPPLPSDAKLSDKALKAAEKSGDWYKHVSKWASERSPMTPPHFMQGATLWLAGLALARRCCLTLHERIYPHVYLLIVAETSRFAKSTGMNVFHSIVMATMPYMLIPGSATTEAMMEILSGQLPGNYDKLSGTHKKLIEKGQAYAGQRGIMLDEYSSLLGAGKKEYMQGFVELLMRLYDAREVEQHYTRSGGLLTITRPGISIFGATTPAAMARSLNNEAWENGEMARYMILFRDEVLPYNDSYGKVDIPASITRPLLTAHNALPLMKTADFDEEETSNYQPLTASIEPEALTAYRDYARAVRHDLIEDCDPRLQGNYTRLHVQAIKAALSIAAMDYLGNGENHVRVTLGHWALAQSFVEHSRANLHSLLFALNETKDARIQRDILAIVRQNPGGLTVRDFCRRMNAYADDIRRGLDILLDSGELEEKNSNNTTGRPTKIYLPVSAIK